MCACYETLKSHDQRLPGNGVAQWSKLRYRPSVPP
jgi:hypothetical protein